MPDDLIISIDEEQVAEVIEGEVIEATDVANPEIGIILEDQGSEELPSPPPVDESVTVVEKGDPGPVGPPGPAGSQAYDEFIVAANGQLIYGPLAHIPTSGDVFINGLHQPRTEFFFSGNNMSFNSPDDITAGDVIGVIYFY